VVALTHAGHRRQRLFFKVLCPHRTDRIRTAELNIAQPTRILEVIKELFKAAP